MSTQTGILPEIATFAHTQINQYCAEQNLAAEVEIATRPTLTIEVPSVLTSSDSAIGNECYMEFVNGYAIKEVDEAYIKRKLEESQKEAFF